MDAKNNLAVAYVRVSTQKQEKSGLSLEQQQRDIKNYCNIHGMELTAVFVEQGSGGNHERDELAKAVELVKQNGGTLIVSKVDRLARSVRKTAELMETIPFESLEYGKQASTLMIQLSSIFAEQELERIRERNQKAIESRQRRNVEKGLPANHGFGNDIFKKRPELQKLACEKSAELSRAKAKAKHEPMVETMKLWIDAHGYKPQFLANYLNSRGAKNAKGNPINANYVKRLFDKYIGKNNKSDEGIRGGLHFIQKGLSVREYINLDAGNYVAKLNAGGYSMHQIAKHFNDNGVQTAGGGKFYAQTIKRILEKNQN